MSKRNYKLLICEATNPELATDRERCVMKHSVWARKAKEDEKGDYVFLHPRGIDEMTHAFEDYYEMRTSDGCSIFHVKKVLKSPEN